MENKIINVQVADPVFLDKENKRLNVIIAHQLTKQKVLTTFKLVKKVLL